MHDVHVCVQVVCLCICVVYVVCLYVLFGVLSVGARCSSVVRAFTHGVMDHQIDPSLWTHGAISRFSQCSTTGVTKAVVCAICMMVHIKEPSLLIRKSTCGSSGFHLSLSFMICLIPYNHK